MKPLHLLTLTAIAGCALHAVKTTAPKMEAPETPTAVTAPASTPSVHVSTTQSTTGRKIPEYVLPDKGTYPRYPEAIALIREHGNSDGFFAYVRGKRTYFSHFTGTVDEAIEKLRACLDKGEKVFITFEDYYGRWWKSDAIGAWNGYVIKQNTEKLDTLDFIERAGHLYHETTHYCGFKHQGNEPGQFDNRNSVPYAMGYDLVDYVDTMTIEVARK